jgi:hypothetical protein
VLAVEGAKNNLKANVIAPVAKSRMTEDLMGDLVDRFGPEYVSPLVAWLSHADVPVTGEVYSVGAGHLARIFIGVTQGYTNTADLTAENIRDHFDEIRNEDGYSVPANLNEELMKTLSSIG